MFFKKRNEELKKLRVETILNSVKQQSTMLNEMIQFIKDYGNTTKRKNNKLKYDNYMMCKDRIISIPLSLCVADYIIAGSSRLKKKFNNLLSEVESGLQAEIDKAKAKEELKRNIKGVKNET